MAHAPVPFPADNCRLLQAFPLISFCNKNYLILEIDFNPGPRNCCLTTNSSTILCTFRFFFCMLSLGREREREREKCTSMGKYLNIFDWSGQLIFECFHFLSKTNWIIFCRRRRRRRCCCCRREDKSHLTRLITCKRLTIIWQQQFGPTTII